MSQADGLKRFFNPGPLSVGQLVTLPSEQSSHMVAVLRIGPASACGYSPARETSSSPLW
jgi:16S rRNA U1498 N3-methylase RsmE